MKIILIIGVSWVNAKYLAEAVKRLGYDPLFVCELENYTGDTKTQLLDYPCLNINTCNVAELINKLKTDKRAEKFSAVVTMDDEEIPTTCRVGEALNLRHIDKNVLKLTNKHSIVQLVPSDCPQSIIFTVDAIDIEQIRSVAKCGDEIIIKPTHSAAAIGVFVVNKNTVTFEEVRNQIAAFPHLSENKWVAQERILGDLISLEGYVLNGQIHFIGFSGREKVGQTETVGIFPGDHYLSYSNQQKAKKIVKNIIDLSQYNNGFFHSEFISNSSDIYIIDGNFGRIGGSGITQQFAILTESTPIDICEHYLKVTLFPNLLKEDNLYKKLQNKLTFSVGYGVRTGGTIKQVNCAEEMSYHTVFVNEGVNVPPIGQSDWSWIGICAGDSYIFQKLDGITIEMQSGDNFKPVFSDDTVHFFEKNGILALYGKKAIPPTATNSRCCLPPKGFFSLQPSENHPNIVEQEQESVISAHRNS